MARRIAALDDLINSLEASPAMIRRLTGEAAEVIDDELRRQISAGQDPNGNAWQLNKDGTQPLKNAAKTLVVVPVGLSVFAKIWGHIALHHHGLARGRIKRQIFPTDGLPSRWQDLLKKRFSEVMQAHFEASNG